MKSITSKIDIITPEDIWQEIKCALQEKFPQRFFEVLRECGALKIILPEIDALFGIPNPARWHPEIDTGIHTILSLKAVAKLTDNVKVRFAVLVHDVGKIETPHLQWPAHYEHEKKGVEIVDKICQRLHIPREYQELAVLVTRHHGHCRNIMSFGDKGVLRLLKSLDAFSQPKRFEEFLIACKADARGRTERENDPYPQADFLREIYKRCVEVNTDAKRLTIIKNIKKQAQWKLE